MKKLLLLTAICLLGVPQRSYSYQAGLAINATVTADTLIFSGSGGFCPDFNVIAFWGNIGSEVRHVKFGNGINEVPEGLFKGQRTERAVEFSDSMSYI